MRPIPQGPPKNNSRIVEGKVLRSILYNSMTKTKTIAVKLPDEQYRHLTRTSHYLSIDRDTDLCLSDLVREALDQAFPMPVDKASDEKQKD